MDALQRAIEQLGSKSALARAVGVVPMAVVQWLTRGLPAERVLDVSRATSWQTTPHELRSDLYPHPHDGLPRDMRPGDAA
jgi:DNA-binding transcriptional regulator YdaS (Cro superfamily)